MMTKLILNEDIDFTSQFQSASTEAEKEQVIEQFLNELQKSPYNVKFDDAAKSYLRSVFVSGNNVYLNSSSPLFSFFIKYCEYNGAGATVTENVCKYILNLETSNIVTDNNLIAKSKVGNNDIIFVADLYNQDYNSAVYLCQVYYWLNNEINVKELHIEEIFSDDEIVTEFCSILGIDKSALALLFKFQRDSNGKWRDSRGKFVSQETVDNNVSPKKISYFFCFQDSVFSYNGKLRDAQAINRAMDYIDSVHSKFGITTDDRVYGSKTDTPEDIVKIVSKWNQAQIDRFMDLLSRVRKG